MYYDLYQSPLCEIILVGDEQGLQNLHLNTGQGKRTFEINPTWKKSADFFHTLKTQLDQYFDGTRKNFDININPQGTQYQKKVWQALQNIPYGKTYTYKTIATNIGNQNASRAVGMANSKNPIPLIIPCHRVVGANGSLTGFAHGLDIKEKLIEFEQSHI